MNVAFAVLLLFFFSPTSAIFDYFKIAETWPGTFCSMRPCLKKPNHFTLHGFWPSNNSGPQPSRCSQEPFDFEKILLLDNIYSYWPSLLGDEKKLWTHEWDKHGTCSDMDQRHYFKSALDIYAKYNITNILGENGIVPSDDAYETVDIIETIRKHIGVVPQLDCAKSGDQLYEVRLCLDVKNQNINCTPTSIKCKQFIYYPRVHAIVENRGGGSTGTMREDAAKYLPNLDVSSTYYDPKARSMREDPLPDADPREKIYGEAAVGRSKYDEDVDINNQTTVWGTGAADIEAASDIMKANIGCKEAAVEDPTPVEEKRLATWGTDVPYDLVVDEKSLEEALEKKDQRKSEEKDDQTRDLGSS